MSNTPCTPSKRYRIDVAALVNMSQLGMMDPNTGARYSWDHFSATEYLETLQAKAGFDADRYCARCEDYDHELAITPDQKRLPRLRPEAMRRLLKAPVGLPWEAAKPSADVHVRERHKIRPSRPTALDACHGCLVSFLDEQELPDVHPTRMAELKDAFAEARAEVSRLHGSRARETREDMLAYTEQLLQRATRRLRQAADACRDAGFEPFRPRSRRDGDEAPDQVVSTELELTQSHHLAPTKKGAGAVPVVRS